MVPFHTRWRCLAMGALMTLASSTIAAAGEPGRPTPVPSSAASATAASTFDPVAATEAYLAVTPVTNTMIRTQEAEADRFGLDAARQPDGEAEVDLKLGEYRKLKPGPLEEFVFFDHPSGYNRILKAMRWKAENLR